MPWDRIEAPAIQLGTLLPLLAGAGIRAEVWSAKLDFLEHCVVSTANEPEDDRIRVADYQRLSADLYNDGVGEWVFAVEPYQAIDAERDERFLARVRSKGDDAFWRRVRRMRELVPSFLEACVERVSQLGPAVVGFTSTFGQNVSSLILSKLLKANNPALKIVFGGANCDGPMGAALHRSFDCIDVVVRGEGERVAPEVFRDLLAGGPLRPQPGLCYRDANGASVVVPQGAAGLVPMSEVPAVDYEEYFRRLPETSYYAEVLPDIRLPYESARGCWWGAKSHCTFCGLNGTSMAFRSKEPRRVARELQDLAAKHRRLDFQVVDNIIDMRHVRELMPMLREQGLDFSIFYETKSNLRKSQVRALKEAGVNKIQPGIESLSTPILRLMKKGVTAFQNIRLLKWCAMFGVDVYWNVLFGFPGEPAEEYPRMASVFESLIHLSAPSVSDLLVTRFSPYHDSPASHGIEVIGPAPFYRDVFPVDASTLADIAYIFRHRHVDGRDIEPYVAPLRSAVKRWREKEAVAVGSLRWRRGPDFVEVTDRRPYLEPADYVFDEPEAQLFLACEDGATVESARRAAQARGHELDADEIKGFLDGLVETRLLYAEDGRYLSLALPVPGRATMESALHAHPDDQDEEDSAPEARREVARPSQSRNHRLPLAG